MNTPDEPNLHPTAMELDRAELGQLPEARRQQLAAHVLHCARCAETQQTLQRAAAHFRAEVFARSLPRMLAASGGPVAGWRRWWQTIGARARWAVLAAPVAAGLVLAVGVFGQQGQRSAALGEEPAVSMKGRPTLHVFARRGDRVFAVQSGETLAPGDAVRLVVEPGGHRYLLIVSIDGTGKVSVYHPFDGAVSASLGPEPRVELPGSIVLDRAPGPERVFALFSDGPLSAAAVRASLQRMSAAGGAGIRGAVELALPGTEQASFVFEKAQPPR
jgi:hypothetical protein